MKNTLMIAMVLTAIVLVAGAAQAAPGLKVRTDKNNYAVGEDVQVSIVNEWKEPIGTGLGYYVTTPNGEMVWQQGWDKIYVTLQPGESLDYTWNQTYHVSGLGDDFEQVEPGTYVIHHLWGSGRANIRIA